MTLKEVGFDMVYNAYTWVKAHSDKDAYWLKQNFPSVFLKSGDNLTKTLEFPNSYKNREFLNSNSFMFVIEKNELKEVKFFCSPGGNMLMQERNKLQELNNIFSDALNSIKINGLPAFYKTQLLDRIDRHKTENMFTAPMYDTRQIELFNFKIN